MCNGPCIGCLKPKLIALIATLESEQISMGLSPKTPVIIILMTKTIASIRTSSLELTFMGPETTYINLLSVSLFHLLFFSYSFPQRTLLTYFPGSIHCTNDIKILKFEVLKILTLCDYTVQSLPTN